MKYLTKFGTQSEYDSFANSDAYEMPNVSLVGEGAVKYNDYSKIPLTIKALESGNFALVSEFDFLETDLQYSKNGGERAPITSADTISVNTGDILELYGNNTCFYYYNEDDDEWFQTCFSIDFECDIYGNIMSIFNGNDFKTNSEFTPGYQEQCYYLFSGCKIVDASKLILPATTLANSCYEYMFNNCDSLTSAPELPATTLARSCYYSMFAGCTSLTSAPELPATTLESACYYSMFRGCASLTSAPELPATTLANNCYYGMFDGCTSLTSAPALPATTLADYCYNRMFNGCSKLTSAPELPATTLASSCYDSMFNGCSKLTSAPELPATTLASYCYRWMFYGCSNLTSAPELPATTLASSCYASMFAECRSLNRIKCLATNKSATSALTNWVQNVAASGTFVKKSGVSWPSGVSGIPNGWTVQEV